MELGQTSAIGEVTADEKGAKRMITLGAVKLAAAGVQTLRLIPEKAGWQGLKLYQVELQS